jgi:hypothetical protein
MARDGEGAAASKATSAIAAQGMADPWKDKALFALSVDSA